MQTTNAVFMVSPAGFSRNEETANNNFFQQKSGYLSGDDIKHQALDGFNQYVAALRRAGISVTVFEDHSSNETPDAVFPNNWITTHPDGQVILYPMEALNRRKERRRDYLDILSRQFQLTRVTDLSHHELSGYYLEGTGAMVCDHDHHRAYICRSSRSSEVVMNDLVTHRAYQPIWFDACDQNRRRIYHTNVMMSVGIRFAVVCLESIVYQHERQQVIDSLQRSGKTIIPITRQQMNAFCGNILELKNAAGEPVIAMSVRAWRAFTRQQQTQLADYAHIVQAPIDIIEDLGGGGARCMLAENFLPPLPVKSAPLAMDMLTSG